MHGLIPLTALEDDSSENVRRERVERGFSLMDELRVQIESEADNVTDGVEPRMARAQVERGPSLLLDLQRELDLEGEDESTAATGVRAIASDQVDQVDDRRCAHAFRGIKVMTGDEDLPEGVQRRAGMQVAHWMCIVKIDHHATSDHGVSCVIIGPQSLALRISADGALILLRCCCSSATSVTQRCCKRSDIPVITASRIRRRHRRHHPVPHARAHAASTTRFVLP